MHPCLNQLTSFKLTWVWHERMNATINKKNCQTENYFMRCKRHPAQFTALKYSLDLVGSATIYKGVGCMNEAPTVCLLLSGSQLAGHTSPCSSVNWNALTRRMVSSTDRPTGKSLMVICRTKCLGSMMKSPLGR